MINNRSIHFCLSMEVPAMPRQLVSVSGVIMDSTNLPVVANFGRGFDWTISNTQTSGYASTITGAPHRQSYCIQQ